MTARFDLSLILTAHDETLVSGPTIAAAEAAVACAEAAGHTVEKIVVLDNATPETRSWYGQPALESWLRLNYTEGDLGRVRNAVLPKSNGRFIAFLDADDIFSENWLREGVSRLKAAEEAGDRVIAHPELNWLFDGAHSVYHKPDQDDPLFTPWHFYAMNYYDSLCMTPRQAHLDHPYIHRDIPAGLSFQDWYFSIDTMAAGWKHVSVRDTIIFKRRRDESLVNESRARRSLVRHHEALSIDQIDDLGRTAPNKPASRENVTKTAPNAALKGFMGAAGHILGIGNRAKRTTPHYGSKLAELLNRDYSVGRVPAHAALYYPLVTKNFDQTYYLAKYSDICELENFDPVAHYLRAGWKEGRDPASWFSTKAYLARYKDVAASGANPFLHWLTKGWKAGYVPRPVEHFDVVAETIGLTPLQALGEWRARYDDLQQRLSYGALGEQVKKAAEFDPLVEIGWTESLQVKIPPFHSDVVTARTATMWLLGQAAGMRRARNVICVNRARFGGAARMEGHLARALAARDGADEVVVITTDQAGPLPEGKLPEGIRHIDFADIASQLKPLERERFLAEFLRSLRPENLFNVNSRLTWQILTPYGKALASSMRIYCCLLCNEQNQMGYWTGYPLRRFYRHFEILSGVFTDSYFLADELTTRYMIPQAEAHRVKVLSNPVDTSIPAASAPKAAADRRPQVFWAGRFDAQKRPDLAIAIAQAMPDTDFRLWGEAVMGKSGLPDDLPSNVQVSPPFQRFDELPLDEADAWLYTAAWDGVPMILLEVAMAGIPLVGSDVGGTKEVLRPGFAKAMEAQATPKDWVEALRAVLDDPTEAREKAAALREQLIVERTSDHHRAQLSQILELPARDPQTRS